MCAVGRSGTGKTAACQAFTQALLKQAGTMGENISGELLLRLRARVHTYVHAVHAESCPPPAERVQAMFTVLKSFGCVSSQHSDASSRFAMVFSLDFNHAGQAAAGHLQVRDAHTTLMHAHAHVN